MPTKKKVATMKPVDDKVYRCLSCGVEYDNPVNKFFKTTSRMYDDNDKYYPVCRKCLEKKFDEYRNRYGEHKAMMMICHYLDVPFYFSLYDSVIHSNDSFTIGMYLRQMNNRQYMNKSFVNTLIDKKELGIEKEDYEEIKEEQWSVSEVKNKRNVIEIIGYDPFDGYDEQQRKFLFNNIIGYLEEDGIEDDVYKISQIIQLVNNNYQIEQLNKVMAKLNPEINMEDLKGLSNLKKNLVDSNDKIAKENGISVKNRTDREAGRSTLTYLIKHLRELEVPKAETNYYDQLKSDGTQWAANMSLKAIRENGFFDENDFKDMAEMQYLKIQELQAKVDDLEEDNRLLLIENDNLKAGDKE